MENKLWFAICILGGILMIIGSVIGSVSFFAILFEFASKYIGKQYAPTFSIVLTIFGFIATAGGISVICGTIIVALDHYKFGKFVIGLGAGMGLIGLIIFLVTGVIAGTLVGAFAVLIIALIGLHGGFGFAGVLLTILARRKLKKEKSENKQNEPK